MKRKRKFECGDLVKYKDTDGDIVKGVIIGTPDDDYVISKHYSVKNVIVHFKKLTMIKRQFIPKHKLKYI